MTAELLTEFKTLVAEIQDLRTTQGLLGWDLETFMPANGADIRAGQMATLAKLSHQMLTSDRMGGLLDTLKTAEELSRTDAALLREVGKEYTREKKLPVSLVQAMTQATAKAQPIWQKARQDNDFSAFAPVLKDILDLTHEMTDAIGYEGSPYNALLDLYEPDLTVAQLDPLFSALKPPLVELVAAIQDSLAQPDMACIAGKTFDREKQLAFTETVLKDMGFDFSRGRQDASAHPFTMGMGCNDVRLTTRVFEDDPFSALYSSVHEGGHGLYEQGVDPSLARTFLDGGVSLGIHESQSRMWENVVGRSKPFWSHYYPAFQQLFSEQLSGVPFDTFYAVVNRVEPSLVRVESDEVTYNLHILLRYEIEKDLIENRLAVSDLPEAWNAKMREYLGVTPPTDTEGVLQDVHWAHGSFGYFPTYTLGNLYSVQFYNAAKRALPQLEADIAVGKLTTLTTWLNREIHQWSKLETPAETVERVTGEPLNSAYFVTYLQEKYGQLYNLGNLAG